MKKIVSLLIVFSMVFTFALNAFGQTEIDKSDTPSGLSTETINQLVDEYVTVKSDGLLEFHIQQARKSKIPNSTLKIMQDIIDDVNVRISNEDLIMGSLYSEETIDVKNLSIGPWTEPTRMTYCLRKRDAIDLADDLRAQGYGALKAYIYSNALTALGFSKFFSVPAAVASTVLSTTSLLGNTTSGLSDEIDSQVRYMNDNQYLVMNISIQNEWQTLGDWMNEKSPHKSYFLYVVDSWITNYKVDGDGLLEYLYKNN